MINRILELKSLPDDWNGYGASAAKPEAINNALVVAELLQKQPDSVYLDNGDVVIYWKQGEKSLLLSIDETPIASGFIRGGNIEQPKQPAEEKAMTDLNQRIAKLRELDKALTDKKWKITEHNWSDTSIYLSDGRRLCFFDLNDWDVTEENQEELEHEMGSFYAFIAAAPEMMQVIEEQDKQLTQATETIKKMAEALRSCEFKEFGGMTFRDDLVCDALELAKPWMEEK